MPKYTTSYNKRKPTLRRSGGGRFDGRRRTAARGHRGGQYLRHSQGFGSGGRGRRALRRGNDRRPYAIVVVGCAFLVFLAAVIWYANRSVDVTLNGETVQARINSTVGALIDDQELDVTPGDLLAVDDSVLQEGGGERYAVKVDGKRVRASKAGERRLKGGEKITVKDGRDVYEPHDVQATAIQPTLTVEGTGAIQYVSQWGVPGRRETWTGETSGKTQDRGTVQEAVNCVVTCDSVSPSKAKAKYIALTFDEAPSSRTQEILDILAQKGVPATFFLQGDHATQYPDAAKAIADAGCELGSNSAGDADLTELSGDELRSQITSGFDAIEQASGSRPAMLRAPFAAFSEQEWAQSMDLVSAVVSWNLDSGDWLLSGADTEVSTVVDSASNGDIVLFTDTDEVADQTLVALPQIIDQLQAAGYRFVTLSDLVKTDKKLSKALDLSRVTMPKDAVLPQVSGDNGDEGADTGTDAAA